MFNQKLVKLIDFLISSHRDSAFPAILWSSTPKRHFKWWVFSSPCSSHNWTVDIFEKWDYKGRDSLGWPDDAVLLLSHGTTVWYNYWIIQWLWSTCSYKHVRQADKVNSICYIVSFPCDDQNNNVTKVFFGSIFKMKK